MSLALLIDLQGSTRFYAVPLLACFTVKNGKIASDMINHHFLELCDFFPHIITSSYSRHNFYLPLKSDKNTPNRQTFPYITQTIYAINEPFFDKSEKWLDYMRVTRGC